MRLLEASVLKGQKSAVQFNTVFLKQDKLAIKQKLSSPGTRYQFLCRWRNKFIIERPHLLLWHAPFPRFLEVSQLCTRVSISISFSTSVSLELLNILRDFLWKKKARNKMPHVVRKAMPDKVKIWLETFEEANLPQTECSEEFKWISFCLNLKNHKRNVTRMQRLIPQRSAVLTCSIPNAHLDSCLDFFS